MGVFGGIGGVKTTEQKGIFLPAGNHELVVERCKIANSKVGNRTFFIVESTVTETDSDSIRPGARASWVVRLGGDYPEMALSDIKSFAVAASGADGVGDLISGRKVACTVEEVATKRGGVFSKHYWATLEEEN
mgnify:CR=1 FL=1